MLRFLLCLFAMLAGPIACAQPPEVHVTGVRQIFDNGQHNAFTDMVTFEGQYFLTFRSCPDGHMLHPTSSIIVQRSSDLNSWETVHQFSVPLRDVRDPHFLVFKGKLFVYTGTWYCGETSPPSDQRDLNLHLGFGVYSSDGTNWSPPQMLEGTFGHYIWRAATDGQTAFLCGRRKAAFAVRPRAEQPTVESAMLESDDGLVWRTKALFQETDGNETAFLIEPNRDVLGVARRADKPALLLRSSPPYHTWQRSELEGFIGGPLLAHWGDRILVGGRRIAPEGPRTALYWLENETLHPIATLPSGGDNSYPGFLPLSKTKGVVSWYSSHQRDAAGRASTNIYMADLEIVAPRQELPTDKKKIAFTSSFDGTEQLAYLSIPVAASQSDRLRPLVVSLHSWSGDLEQPHSELESLVAQRGWFCLQPNFRGINDDPSACGSESAQHDIADAVAWAIKHHRVDPDRVYLTGTSGGGHMTMMMAAKFPELWASASAWVGISDLAAWYVKHADGRYGEMMRACCGGAPGDLPEVDQQYHDRSPKHFLAGASGIPLEIAAGIHDGHAGSVPVRQSLEAFNVIASAVGQQTISEREILELSEPNGRLSQPTDSDIGQDPNYERKYYLRRSAGRARVTIFEGGHEGIPQAAMAWFDLYPRKEVRGQ